MTFMFKPGQPGASSILSAFTGGAIALCLMLTGCGTDAPQYIDGFTSPDGGSGGGGGGLTGLPCDVSAVLTAHCTSCHGSTLSGGATVSLVSYANLTAKSPVDATKTVAQRSLVRMQDGTMPPGGGVPAAEIATFQTWVNAGAAQGTCTSGGGTDPLNAAPICTSTRTWTGGNRGTALMRPGEACLACHTRYPGDAPRLAFGGTVYPTGHEPDGCLGSAAAGAVVKVTDASKRVFTMTVNANGNFSYEPGTTPTMPYTAVVVATNGKTRAMASSQTNGDCNVCHTQSGASGAPGRITLP